MNEQNIRNSNESFEEKGERYPQIYLSGREAKVPGPNVSYKQIVTLWNKVHEDQGLYIEGTPGISYDNAPGNKSGVLLPGESVSVIDGTSFSVDANHVS